MNQRYLLLSTLLVAGTCIAQSSRQTPYAMQHDDGTVQAVAPLTGNLRDGGDVIFSDDFANGLAGNNGVGAWTTSGPNGDIWKHTTTGPVGSYSVPTQIIAQPAPANGFMAFLSDSANCNCTSGTANWPATPTEWDGALESPLLDLTATPSVMLQWQQRLRWCCQAISPHAVEVSTDGGLTWPTTLEAATGIATNNDPGTQTRQLMLTAAISADPSQVKFRFKHNATAAAYHWQIDDVQLIELYSDDMLMEDGYLSHTGTGEEYGRIPAGQLNPTMLIGGNVTNSGAAEQTNVTVTVDVLGAVPFNTVIPAGSILPGVTFAAEQDYTLPALTDGLYEATFNVAADAPDQITTNNTALRNFEVTPNRYSVDGLGNHPAGLETTGTLGTQSFTGATDGLILLNYYEVREALTVYGIEMELGTTVAGGYVIASLRDTTPVFATPPAMTTVIAETDPYDITATNVTSGIAQVCFTTPVDLAPNGYFGSVSLFSNAGASHIRVIDDLTVPQPGITSAIYIPNDDLYSNGNAMAVRLITNASGTACAVGIHEDNTSLSGVTIFPSLTTGEVNVRTQRAGNYTIEVLDLLGQVVYSTSTLGSTVLDLSGQTEGVYMVRVSSANASTIQRITLN